MQILTQRIECAGAQHSNEENNKVALDSLCTPYYWMLQTIQTDTHAAGHVVANNAS
jgi:hypothetical protein